MNRALNLGFYYTHYQCLGHTTRVLTLLRNLKDRFPSFEIHCFHASHPQKFLIPAAFLKNHTLPFPLYSRANFLKAPVFNSAAAFLRAKACLNLVKKLSLDVFFTEYFPLGRGECRYELMPALYCLAKKRKIICASAGYPVIPENNFRVFRALSVFYQKIFIHTPAIEMDYVKETYRSEAERKRYTKIFADYAGKITYTNYILPLPLVFRPTYESRLSSKKNKINVLVTRGAGAYYPNIISSAIEASDLLGDGFYFNIIAGPSTPEQDWLRFQNLMKKKKVNNARLIKNTSLMQHLIRESDLCVSTAGYNTSVLLLYCKKNAVIIPFEGYGDLWYREQTARARLLSDFLGAKIIAYNALSGIRLARQVARSASINILSAKWPINQDWFSGKDLFLKEFEGLIKGSGAK